MCICMRARARHTERVIVLPVRKRFVFKEEREDNVFRRKGNFVLDSDSLRIKIFTFITPTSQLVRGVKFGFNDRLLTIKTTRTRPNVDQKCILMQEIQYDKDLSKIIYVKVLRKVSENSTHRL